MADLYAYAFSYDKPKNGGFVLVCGHFFAVSEAEAKGKAAMLFEADYEGCYLRGSVVHLCATNMSDVPYPEAPETGYPKPEFTF